MTSSIPSADSPVLHVVVVGFHHKKGSQVEYSYPPLIEGAPVDSHETPPEWKNLPSLAIPDGAHNYVKDTVYFHLPALEGSNRTVYGVACYRQIDSSNLKNRTTDITRSTVQKSVCVLSYLPLYGLIKAKLELITQLYFHELDFSKVALLEETYKNLTVSLTTSLLDGGSQVYLGMNVKDIVVQFRHKIILLFKLILLERRVLFTGSPVETLGNSLLAILSLFPGMIEHGLVESTVYGVHQRISNTLAESGIGENDEEFLEVRYSTPAAPDPNVDCPVGRSLSEEPESPTIERGDPLNKVQYYTDSGQSGTKTVHITKTTPNAKRVHNAITVHTTATPVYRQLSDPKARVHRHSEGMELVEDHYSDKSSDAGVGDGPDAKRVHCDRSISHDSEGSESHDRHQQILLADNSEMMMGVTQYEAVQAGKCIPKNGSVINIEDFSQSIDMEEDYFGSVSERATQGSAPGDLSLSAEDGSNSGEQLDSVGKRQDTVEELDSPESISQIDREDCFSWEHERVSLSIDTGKHSFSLDENAGLASSFKETHFSENMKSEMEPTSGEVTGKKGGLVMTGCEEEGVDVKRTVAGSTPSKEAGGDGSSGSNTSSPGMKAAAIKSRLTSAFSGLNIKQKLKVKQGSREGSQGDSEPPSPSTEDHVGLPCLQQDDQGLPLAVFTKGCVCFPYLSLQFYDVLNDVNVRSFVIGATNILFRQKRHLTDVVVDVTESKIEVHDRELQKQLTLTTADLRFADVLVKAVMGTGDDIYLEGTEWEGNDEWLRAQFRLYLESLLATTLSQDAKLLEDFGTTFLQAWQTTHNYRVWASTTHSGMKDVQTGHPCQGNLGVADIRMRLSHTMQNTEGGKKINAAVTQTGKYVVQTGKAVGGALNQAKSSLSSWFTSLAHDWKTATSQHTGAETKPTPEGPPTS